MNNGAAENSFWGADVLRSGVCVVFLYWSGLLHTHTHMIVRLTGYSRCEYESEWLFITWMNHPGPTGVSCDRLQLHCLDKRMAKWINSH